MGRTARDNRDLPHPRPVQKVQLSEDHARRRLIAVVLLVLLGGAALAYALFQLLTPEPGWQAVEASASAGITCADEFVFLYELGSGGVAVQAESRAVTALYSQACRKAYQMFSTAESFEDVTSLRDLNLHPNETLTVDEALYRAFETVERYGDRTIYLGPVYARYSGVFSCRDDSQLVDFDPYASEEVRQEYEALAAYANDPQAIRVRLLGEGRVCLDVSEDYLAYARREGVTDFLDFGWLKNAFIADYLADVMGQNGYTHGSISSFDGFSRNLDSRGLGYALNLYDWLGDRPIQAAALEYRGPMSLVSLQSFPINAQDTQRFYRLKDGQVRTMYLDPEDGRCRSALDSMVCCSQTRGCAETALEAAPIFIAQAIREGPLRELGGRDIQYICCSNRIFRTNNPELALASLYELDGVKYTVEFDQ